MVYLVVSQRRRLGRNPVTRLRGSQEMNNTSHFAFTVCMASLSRAEICVNTFVSHRTMRQVSSRAAWPQGPRAR